LQMNFKIGKQTENAHPYSASCGLFSKHKEGNKYIEAFTLV
jgi:hypothetical protein